MQTFYYNACLVISFHVYCTTTVLLYITLVNYIVSILHYINKRIVWWAHGAFILGLRPVWFSMLFLCLYMMLYHADDAVLIPICTKYVLWMFCLYCYIMLTHCIGFCYCIFRNSTVLLFYLLLILLWYYCDCTAIPQTLYKDCIQFKLIPCVIKLSYRSPPLDEETSHPL